MRIGRRTRLESIVFDFDGTLAELRIDFSQMKERLGLLAGDYLPFAPRPTLLPALEWIDELAADIHRTDGTAASEFQERASDLIVEMELEAACKGSLFPFTRGLLSGLLDKGVKIAVITRNCERAIRMVFPDVDEYCSTLLARDHVPRVKPDPDHLLRALACMAAPLETALVVGDHPLDIQTGKRAGILTAGVSSGRVSRVELARSGADWAASNCEELITILEKQDFI
jgi:phosphoglycolate phosphatase